MSRKIIDLFAGAGGLSLGAKRAGFNVVGAVEIDQHAISTHKKNFPNVFHIQKSVAELSGKEILKDLRITKKELKGIIGGPPCQGFSTIGKRNLEDPRNNLFNDFFRIVSELEPDFFVAENVTGILNEKYTDIRNAAFSHVSQKYNLLPPLRIKASDFGAPTIRTRIFFIGFHRKKIQSPLQESDFYKQATKAVTVEEALRGLPQKVQSTWLKESDSWQPIEKEQFGEDTFFQKISSQIPIGVGDQASIKRYLEQNLVSGCHGTRHAPEIEKRYKELKIGEQDKISKSVKLKPYGYCPTLRAGTGSDKGSYQAVRPIHYMEPRVITPREAARLQGFPDWFVFHETKWHSFRQIGNSVSPIVAEAILEPIYKILI
ncbi:MAG: DNA cytosine methyltransferase [Acinetobacter populi]|jgi:DNA (cytosine-5)-methyltransferase 1|uniref:DNA cytosine methyltransferase n=1 Tax=Acinetobacter populi TaxID=1582270 RepID=UPI002352B852|nr:DNA cytosine methyltransferase [Acinetobacter populi]MCH4247617.1 DNA cytosine methyltransferase [Acinetobacter populi]